MGYLFEIKELILLIDKFLGLESLSTPQTFTLQSSLPVANNAHDF
jgi:hypothetical protein